MLTLAFAAALTTAPAQPCPVCPQSGARMTFAAPRGYYAPLPVGYATASTTATTVTTRQTTVQSGGVALVAHVGPIRHFLSRPGPIRRMFFRPWAG